MLRRKRPSMLMLSLSLNGFRCDRCAGRIKNASTSENVSARITTSASGNVIFAAAPSMNSVGENAIIVVMAAKMTGLATRLAPW